MLFLFFHTCLKKIKYIIYVLFYLLLSFQAHSQNQVSVIVKDSLTHETIVGATIVLENTTYGSVTNINGLAVIDNVPSGNQVFQISLIGYRKKIITINSISADPHIVFLATNESQLDEVIISTTRTNSRIEDAPVKVEVLGLEELNEENSIKPGNVSSILGDISSVQVQQLSPVNNSSVIRMQGLDGKYTLLLRDGMPSFGGLSGGLSVLQIPPLDLKQIEIIKGPSSTLNGGGAIAGLINFISKQPSDSSEAAFTLNRSTMSETNFNAYLSSSKNQWGYTFLGSCTNQQPVDVNKDNFSDVPLLHSYLLHPQLFYSVSKKTKIKLGLTSSFENRTGGNMKAIKCDIDSLNLYSLNTQSARQSADFTLTSTVKNKSNIVFKSSITQFNRKETTNSIAFNGDQWNSYSELSYSMLSKNHQLTFGGNYIFDDFKKLSNDNFPVSKDRSSTAGIFAQYVLHHENKIDLQAGLRGDYNSAYKWFVLPSVAALFHTGKNFSIRINGGAGYKTPDLLEIVETSFASGETGYAFDSNIKAERSIGGTAEWNFKKIIKNTSIIFNQTFFLTQINNSIIQDANAFTYSNSKLITSTKGIDNYIRINRQPYELYIGYTYTLPVNSINSEQPYFTYTPLHRAALTLIDRLTEQLRIGFETSYNGFQYRDNGAKTKDYFFLAASLQYKTGMFTFVLNAENLLDFRQSKYEQIVGGTPSDPQFAKLWAPIDGRVFNLSVMLKF